MKIVSQKAVVLGGINYSDSSRVIWILTPEFGRQSLMVKGARRAKSKYLGKLETFSLVSVIYNKRPGASMYTLREVDLLDDYSGLRASLEAFWAASEAVKLIKAACAEDHESAGVFELLAGFLSRAADCRGDRACLEAFLLAFRWNLVSHLGLAPRLLECVLCGAHITRSARYCFLMVEGGVICSKCQDAAQPPCSGNRAFASFLTYPSLRFIYRATRKFPRAPEDLLPLSQSESSAVDDLARRYLGYHLGESAPFEKGDFPTPGGRARKTDRPARQVVPAAKTGSPPEDR